MIILFDIGKTNMRVAYSADGQSFDKPLVAPTPSDYQAALTLFTELIRGASLGRPIKTISGGLPGTLNPDRSGLLFAPPPINNWENQPFTEYLRNEFNCDVVLHNDSVLVALGEAIHGAGKGHEIVGYLTFSTGLGGARISHGAVDTTAYGFEPGKLKIPQYGEGATAEDFTSGSGLHSRYDRPPYEIRETEVWDLAAKVSGYVVHAATLFWSPNILILGGPMVLGDPAIPFDQIEKEALSLLGDRGKQLKLARASLEGFGGLWGALAVVEKPHSSTDTLTIDASDDGFVKKEGPQD